MKKNLTPIFIIGSGRSGSRMIYRLLSGFPDIEAYHEFGCTHIQPLAAKFYMGLISKNKVKEEIMKIHGAAIYYSEVKYWVDSSNKLSWLIEPLYELFPNSKFIHIVRDGRKVVSSFFYKLSQEIYDDRSVEIMTNWIKNPKKFLIPPPEKKYWWVIPQKGQPHYCDFSEFNQFERICYHWDQVIKTIHHSFRQLPKKNTYEFKLEELTTQKSVLKDFLSIMNISFQDHLFEYVQKPQNVFFPLDLKINNFQVKQFNKICDRTMKLFGYTHKKEYEVKY